MIRKFIFWTHLLTGTTLGLIILSMSITGMMLAFEPQIVEFAERNQRNIVLNETHNKKQTLKLLTQQAINLNPTYSLSGITIDSKPNASFSANFGEKGGTLYLNPYNGELLGRGSQTHNFMNKIENWHRWLGNKKIGKPITDAAVIGFLLLLFSGIIIWWPKNWNLSSIQAITIFNPNLKGKARDWNWHNVIGFWLSPLILMTTVTGIIMSYTWANDLLYRITGNEPPFKQQRSDPSKNKKPEQKPHKNEPQNIQQKMDPILLSNLTQYIEQATEKAPDWDSITVRFPQKSDAPVSVWITQEKNGQPDHRSQLNLNPSTVKILEWKPATEQNLGLKLRIWTKNLHTGTAFDLWGQTLAFLSASGISVLVWTGIALAWRRFQAWKIRKEKNKILTTEK